MRNFLDNFYDKTPRTKITEELQRLDEFSPSMNDLSDNVLSSKLKLLQLKRPLALWHDGSTYWWWSMFCMITISFTHLRNINKKQANSFKIAMRQLNSRDQIRIFILSSTVAPQLHFWISLKGEILLFLPNPSFYHFISPKIKTLYNYALKEYWQCVLHFVLSSISALS